MSIISLIDPKAEIDAKYSRKAIDEVKITPEIIIASPWSPLLMHNKEMKGENFKEASILAFDIDNKEGDPQLSLADAIKIFKNYKVIIAPTKNHQKWKNGESPRDKYRIILFYETVITNGEQYKQNYIFYNKMFFQPKTADNVGDLGRFFYASSSIAYVNNNGLVLEVRPLRNTFVSPSSTALSGKRGELTPLHMKFLAKTEKIKHWHNQTLRLMTDMKDKGYSIEEVREKVSALGWQNWDEKDERRLQDVFKNPKTFYKNHDNSKESMFTTLLADLNDFFEDKLLIYEDSKGNTAPIKKVTSTIVEDVSINACIDSVVVRAHEIGLPIMKDTAEKIFHTWVSTTANTPYRIQKLPPAFSMNPEEITYNYINIHLKEGPTPTWDEFIKQCGANGKALMAFTWSIFQSDCKSPQYLFLRGHGEDGKGSYTEWLEEIVGKKATAALSIKNQHWPHDCVGKRLGLWPEINNTSFVMSTEFKAITGGDSVTITQKYERAYTATLSIKFILTTNQDIEVSSKNSEKRRMILCDMQPPIKMIVDYKRKIREEGPAFLLKCKQAYEELYDKEFLKINADHSAFELHSANFEDEFEVVWEKCFKYTPGEKTRSPHVTEAINMASRSANTRFRVDFGTWMERVKGIKKVRSNGVTWYKDLELTVKHALVQKTENGDI